MNRSTRRHTAPIALLLVAGALACTKRGDAVDGTAIYAAVLEESIASLDAEHRGAILLGERTSTEMEFEEWGSDLQPYLAKQLPDLDPDTWRDFVERNRTQGGLPDLSHALPAAAILDPDIEAALDSPSVSAYRRITDRYGEPWILLRVSQIGVSRSQDQALVYSSLRCHLMHCGQGHYTLVERTNDEWQVRSVVRSWIE